jgi:hypothetical protein
MVMDTVGANIPEPIEPRSGFPRVMGIVVLVVIGAVLLSGGWLKRYVYASRFTPTVLNTGEKTVLESKVAELEATATRARRVESKENKQRDKRPPPEPEAYSEKGSRREIRFTEKELNALIAHDAQFAQRVAINLSENLLSIKLLVPLDESIPILGGKSLLLNLGLTLGFEDGRPVVALKGVSLGGIPLPNAWMGKLKNRNLVTEFRAEGDFWKVFSDGVAGLKVQEGQILIKLKE